MDRKGSTMIELPVGTVHPAFNVCMLRALRF